MCSNVSFGSFGLAFVFQWVLLLLFPCPDHCIEALYMITSDSADGLAFSCTWSNLYPHSFSSSFSLVLFLIRCLFLAFLFFHSADCSKTTLSPLFMFDLLSPLPPFCSFLKALAEPWPQSTCSCFLVCVCVCVVNSNPHLKRSHLSLFFFVCVYVCSFPSVVLSVISRVRGVTSLEFEQFFFFYCLCRAFLVTSPELSVH